MADRWLIKAGGVYTGPAADIWDAAGWPNDPIGDTFGFNEGLDTALMDANVLGNFTLNVNMACAALNSTDYAQTIALGVNNLAAAISVFCEGTVTGSGDISVAGTLTFLAGTDTSGWTGTLIADWLATPNPQITTNGVTIPNFQVDNDGVTTCVLQDNMTVGDLTHTAGIFTTTGRTVTLIAGGVTSDVSWNTADYPLAHLIIPDNAKATLAGRVQVEEITFGSGVGGVSMAGVAGRDLYCRFAGNDMWHQTAASGDVSPDDLRIYASANIEIGYLDASALGALFLLYATGGSRTITMTDHWTAGAIPMTVSADAAPNVGTLDTAGYDLTAGVLTIGFAGAVNASGVLDLATGRHSLDSITPGHNDNQNNALDLATCFLTLANDSALTNTNPVTVTSTASIIYGAVTLTDWGCVGWAWAPQATNGGGNGDIIWGTGTSARGRGFMRGAA